MSEKESTPRHMDAQTASLSNTKFKVSLRKIFFSVGCRRTMATTKLKINRRVKFYI